MSKRKFRDLSVVFFVGLFLMTWEPVFLWLFAGALVLFQVDRSENSVAESDHHSVMQQVRQDARRFQVKFPHKPALRSLMVQIYRQYQRAKERYPHLKAEYREVISDMWTNLALDPSEAHWNQILTSVLGDWPTQEGSASQTMKDKLKKVKELSQQWDEAKKEAHGGVRV